VSERLEVFGAGGVQESVGRRIQGLGNDVRRPASVVLTANADAPQAPPVCHGRPSIPASGGVPVSDHVYRLTEVVGSSETSVAEAVRTAVRKASQTVRNIEWFECQEIRGQVVDGDVAYFQVTVKLGFRVD
jgi:flavin-binding protein dodecin